MPEVPGKHVSLDMGILLRQFPHQLGRMVFGTIINEQDFVIIRQRRHYFRKAPVELVDILLFIEDGHYKKKPSSCNVFLSEITMP